MLVTVDFLNDLGICRLAVFDKVIAGPVVGWPDMTRNRICRPIDYRIKSHFPVAQQRNFSMTYIIRLLRNSGDPFREILLNQPAEFFALSCSKESLRRPLREIGASEVLFRHV